MQANNLKEQVFEKVAETLSLVLDIPKEKIKRESQIINDLDAEMIDYHFIATRLANIFELSLFRGRLLQKATAFLKMNIFEKNDCITEEGAKLLKMRLPECKDFVVTGMHSDRILKVFTVEVLVNRIVNGLNNRDKTGEQLYEDWLLNYKKQYMNNAVSR